MNNFTLTDYEEYLAGVLTKHPERVRFATTSSIFLADLTGLVGSDLSCLELGTGVELECLVSKARSLTFAFGFGADCVFSSVFLWGLGVHGFFGGVCHPLQHRMNEMDFSEQ